MLIEEAHSNNPELIPLEGRTPRWYAIYVQCRHEARVESALQRKGVEVFLPRVTTLSRRRPRPMNNCFPKEASSDRILYGIIQMLNKNWRGKTLKQISTILWTSPRFLLK